MSGRKIVVAGGGAVATGKIRRLVKAGALITVIAPALCDELAALHCDGLIRYEQRQYEEGDLAGAFLAIAATSDSSVNLAVAAEAQARGIVADVCDAPELSSFTMPAVMERGDLIIAVSTGGKSPALAKVIRERLEREFGDEYGLTLRLLGALREKLLTVKGNSEYNKALLSQLAAQDLPRLLRERRYDRLDQLLSPHFGSGFSISHFLEEEKDHR